MPNRPVDRDVEISPLNPRKRRQTGDVPYPITYSRQMADFDIWDHMLLNSYSKSLTMHRFIRPPATILDAGCGSGFWAMEAAKHWPDSEVVGFDIVQIQPLLHTIDHLKSISRRIKWVHGNILDGLPFPSDHFDFVRIAGLGLAIPEDEWQLVLEEVYRVMKPGAALEIIEEDLIFPSPSALLQRPTDHLLLGSPPSPISQTPQELLKGKEVSERSSSVHSSARTSSKFSAFSSARYKRSRFSSTSTLNPTSTTSSTDSTADTDHPQDHTRLKFAWDAMLSERFLSPKLVSVIPFYLTSSSFVNTQSHPPLIVSLPSNSGSIPILKSWRSLGSIRDSDREEVYIDTVFDFGPSLSNRSTKTDGCSVRSTITLKSDPIPRPPNWDTMHLAKIVSTIRGCKEAIWVEYDKMYGYDALQVLMRTAPNDEDYASQPSSYVRRRAFEVDWSNWEFDMMDRMDMRSNLLRHLAWAQQPTDPDGFECAVWRKRLERKSGAEHRSGHQVTGSNPDDLCRSLRAFTGLKAA